MSIRAYFSRHAQVLIGSLGRIVQHPFAALMTMGVIAVALALARGPERLAAIRARLAENISSSLLFDIARFCAGIETAYQRMVDRARAGLGQHADQSQRLQARKALQPFDGEEPVVEVLDQQDRAEREHQPGDGG